MPAIFVFNIFYTLAVCYMCNCAIFIIDTLSYLYPVSFPCDLLHDIPYINNRGLIEYTYHINKIKTLDN